MNSSDFSIELEVFLDDLGQNKQSFELKIGSNVVGSNPKECNIVINQPDVEKKHLNIDIELVNKTNTIQTIIQAQKSEKGTQKKTQDGKFEIIHPGKQRKIGDLSQEQVFYIAKKYKLILKKVPKGTKSKSSNGGNVNNRQQLEDKQLDDEQENKQNQQQDQKLDDQEDKSKLKLPKQLGKNFKPNYSPEQKKSLSANFKTQTIGGNNSIQQKNTDQNKAETESKEVQKRKSGENPSKSQEKKSINKKNVETKDQIKNTLKQNQSKESKVEKKNNKQIKPSKKSKELDLSLNLSSNEQSDNEEKSKNNNFLNPEERKIKQNSKFLSTDDEDEDDKKKKSKQTKMIDESEQVTNNQLEIDNVENNLNSSDKNKNKTQLYNKQLKDQQSKKNNLKRKAYDDLDESQLMIIESEDEKTVVVSNNKSKNGKNTLSEDTSKENKSEITQNSITQKKRKNEQGIENKEKKNDKQMKEEGKVKEDEINQQEVKQNDKINKQVPDIVIKKMEDENDNQKIVEDKKINKIPQKTNGQKEQNLDPKKKFIKPSQTENKNTSKEQVSKLDKTNKMKAKKQDKKKLSKRLSQKKNSIVKESLEMFDESDEEISYQINSDGEEEFTLKNNPASKQSASKQVRKFNVLFSNCEFDTDDIYEKLSKLGVRIMKNLQQSFNILVMDDFTRRVKTLVALNKGAKIIQRKWILDCINQDRLIEDLDKYEIKIDKNFAKRYQFDLKEVQQRNIQQDEPIFKDIQFILPDEENYQSIDKDDLEYLINTAGGTLITEEECVDIEDKSNIKVIFDADITSNQIESKDNLSNKKLRQLENRQKVLQAFNEDEFDCVLLESIFQSCLLQKECNWSEFQV